GDRAGAGDRRGGGRHRPARAPRHGGRGARLRRNPDPRAPGGAGGGIPLPAPRRGGGPPLPAPRRPGAPGRSGPRAAARSPAGLDVDSSLSAGDEAVDTAELEWIAWSNP